MKWRKELQLGWRTVYEQNLITNRIMVVWEIPYFIDVVMKFMWNMALNTSNYFIRKNIFVDCLLCFFFFFLSFKNLLVWVMHQIMYFQAFLSNSNFLLSMVNSDVCCSWDTQFFFGREMNTVKNYLDCLLMIGPLVRKGRGKIKNLTQTAFCRCSSR